MRIGSGENNTNMTGKSGKIILGMIGGMRPFAIVVFAENPLYNGCREGARTLISLTYEGNP